MTTLSPTSPEDSTGRSYLGIALTPAPQAGSLKRSYRKETGLPPSIIEREVDLLSSGVATALLLPRDEAEGRRPRPGSLKAVTRCRVPKGGSSSNIALRLYHHHRAVLFIMGG